MKVNNNDDTSLSKQFAEELKVRGPMMRVDDEIISPSSLPYGQLASAQAAGDAAALLLFAAIGRGNHGTDGGSAFTTAAPFLLTWLSVAPWLGAYGKPAASRTDALLAPLPAIAVTVPLGCALRGLLQGYQPPAPFWIVALIATTILIGGWRVAFFTYGEFDSMVNRFTNAIIDEDDGGGEADDF